MLEIGKVYRLSRQCNDPNLDQVDGLPNYFHETYISDANISFEFQRGIQVFRKIKGPDGKERIPVIIVSSSPFKAGSENTPWHDKYDPDHGYIRYYGDNKSSESKPENPNNGILLELLKIYQSDEENVRANQGVPIFFFERVTVNGRLKGNLCYQGFGIVSSAELVTQYLVNKKTSNKDFFSNYKFGFTVFSVKHECEKLDFIKWIGARYNSDLTSEETNKYAPQSWKDWVKFGSDNMSNIRRSIAGNDLVSDILQLPAAGSKEYKLLDDIYSHYSDNTSKYKFEFWAMEVTRKVIEENGAKCIPGWVTQQSTDHGIDYVMRLDVGNDELSGIRIIVLGQAKCTDPQKPTNGRDIARTVARLKRGWIGAYVTTSYFSESVQKEVNEDNYPLMMINGLKVAQIVQEELYKNKMELVDYLDSLEIKSSRFNGDPEDILEK